MANTSRANGFIRDLVNVRLSVYSGGVEVIRTTASAITHLVAVSVTGGITAATSNIVATLGDIQSTAGHLISLVGNAKLGAPAAFATTQPQGAVVRGGTSKSGIAPVGAVATSGAVFASDTVVRKMIADGTASNVET